jgi:AcrR family transcriptional regulator
MSQAGTQEPERGARDRILDVAQARLLERGPTGLVLSAVAEDAGISKGGLLYHFPSKEALIDGLTARMLDRFDFLQESLAVIEGEGPGSWTRAYLDCTVDPDGTPADNSAQLMAGLLAAVGARGEKLLPIRERFAHWHRRLEQDEIDLELAMVVRFAADGLWLSSLLGLPTPDGELMERVISRLQRMTHPEPRPADV